MSYNIIRSLVDSKMTVTTAFTSSFRTFCFFGFVVPSRFQRADFGSRKPFVSQRAYGRSTRKKIRMRDNRKRSWPAGSSIPATVQRCHGATGEGSGNVPPLTNGNAQSATDGEVFWYITHGDADNGMPSWAGLPAEQRWQVVTYVKSLTGVTTSSTSAAASTSQPPAPAARSESTAPPPTAPFTDYRFEKPGTIRHIRLRRSSCTFRYAIGNGGSQGCRPS